MGSDNSLRALGKRIPNLVVVVDSEHGAEFRVQCEVVIEKLNDAALLSEQLRSESKKQIDDAKNKIGEILGGYTTEPKPDDKTKPTLKFKGIILDSFEEVKKHAPKP